MNYQETLDFMYAQLPMYQRVGNQAFKKSLDNIIAFCQHLGNPQERFKCVHVAGTNGKGSCSHGLAAILQSAGKKTGLYTSPHLKSFTERVKVDGVEIPKDAVVQFISDNQAFVEQIKPSFFEMTVALAFWYFAQSGVEYAVIEVGLGGRLDSTNIINPEVCLITNIGYDHQDMLGETLPEIAGEKAGIIKPHTPVIISEYQPEVADVFEEKADIEYAPIIFASQRLNWFGNSIRKGEEVLIENLALSLKGKHQRANAIGMIATALQLAIDLPSIKKGLEEMVEITNLKGRWQQLGEKPLVFCDVGHNEDGIKIVFEQIASYDFRQLHIVWGMANDKKHDKILAMLPKDAKYYFCKPDVPRGLDAEQLQEKAAGHELFGEVYPSVNSAIQQAKAQSEENDFIFVGGSTFVVAEIEDL